MLKVHKTRSSALYDLAEGCLPSVYCIVSDDGYGIEKGFCRQFTMMSSFNEVYPSGMRRDWQKAIPCLSLSTSQGSPNRLNFLLFLSFLENSTGYQKGRNASGSSRSLYKKFRLEDGPCKKRVEINVRLDVIARLTGWMRGTQVDSKQAALLSSASQNMGTGK